MLVPVLPLNAAELTQDDIMEMLEQILFEFPVNEVTITLPTWVEELETKHWLREKFEDAVKTTVHHVRRLRDIETALGSLGKYDFVKNVTLKNMDMGTGSAAIEMVAKQELLYKVLTEETGYEVSGDQDIFRLMRDFATIKQEWDKISAALAEVKESGYGVVTPHLDEMNLEEPELIRQGNRFGVKLKASAPSLHIIRADITTEITPIIGTEKQCEELVEYMLQEFDDDPQKIWNSQIFGKSLHDLVREGIQNKLHRMPESAQAKLQETLQRIINDGSGGLICIII